MSSGESGLSPPLSRIKAYLPPPQHTPGVIEGKSNTELSLSFIEVSVEAYQGVRTSSPNCHSFPAVMKSLCS